MSTNGNSVVTEAGGGCGAQSRAARGRAAAARRADRAIRRLSRAEPRAGGRGAGPAAVADAPADKSAYIRKHTKVRPTAMVTADMASEHDPKARGGDGPTRSGEVSAMARGGAARYRNPTRLVVRWDAVMGGPGRPAGRRSDGRRRVAHPGGGGRGPGAWRRRWRGDRGDGGGARCPRGRARRAERGHGEGSISRRDLRSEYPRRGARRGGPGAGLRDGRPGRAPRRPGDLARVSAAPPALRPRSMPRSASSRLSGDDTVEQPRSRSWRATATRGSSCACSSHWRYPTAPTATSRCGNGSGSATSRSRRRRLPENATRNCAPDGSSVTAALHFLFQT
jgi:hypothetical protein